MRFVVLKDQRSVYWQCGEWIGGQEDGRWKCCCNNSTGQRKRWVRKSGEDGQKNLVDHWQWRLKICPISVLCHNPRLSSLPTGGKGRGLDDCQVSRLGGCKVVPLTRMFVGDKL